MKIIMLFGILMSAITINAQDIAQGEIPSPVLNAFQSKVQNPVDVKWKLKEGVYKVEFEVGTRDHEMWIDKNGVIKRHKEDFPKSQLPPVILQKIDVDFKGYKIDDADKIEENGEIFYQVDLDGPSDERKVLFSEKGEVMRNEVE